MIENNIKKDPSSLMQQAKNGNKDAFGVLYKMYFTPVFRYISLRLKDKVQTEDLAQTVFLKVFRSLHRYREEHKDPLAYFFTVARNTLIDFWRKKRELRLQETDENQIATDYSSDILVTLSEKEKVEKALLRELDLLTENQKEALVLKFISDLSNKQISEVIGKSEEAIRQLQCRGLKTLRDNLKNKIEL